MTATSALVSCGASETASFLLPIFPATAFGAPFDGVHDDQPGIKAAIAAAAAAGGGTVMLPAKQGCLASTLLQLNDNVHIVGAGIPGIEQLALSTGGTALTWIGAAGGVMAIVGPAQNTASGQPIGNADVRGVLFNCADIAGIGLQIQSVNRSRFDVGYAYPLQVGVWITTTWLAATSGSSGQANEATNDPQHNRFDIVGVAGVYEGSTATTLTAAASGNVIQVANPSPFSAGLQVRLGANVYVVASVSGNAVTLNAAPWNACGTAGVAATLFGSDGESGSQITPFVYGVYAHGLPQNQIPAGETPLGSTNPIQAGQQHAGNVSLNTFGDVNLLHNCNGYGFIFGSSDHNYVESLAVYGSPTYGLVFDGGEYQAAGSNVVRYCSASVMFRGATTYPPPSGQPAHTYASQNNWVEWLDTSNGSSATAEPGAIYQIAYDGSTTLGGYTRLNTLELSGTLTVDGPASIAGALTAAGGVSAMSAPSEFLNLVACEAAWEPTTGSIAPGATAPNDIPLRTSTSLTLVNNSSDHLRLVGGTGESGWNININGGSGALTMVPDPTLPACTDSPIVLGTSNTTVQIDGALSLAGPRITAAPSCPTSTAGYTVGDTVINSAPTVLGPTGDQYIVDRWRLTSSGWVAIRAPL